MGLCLGFLSMDKLDLDDDRPWVIFFGFLYVLPSFVCASPIISARFKIVSPAYGPAYSHVSVLVHFLNI